MLKLDLYSTSSTFILLLFLVSTVYVNQFILEGIPHSQDEVSYLFQAKVFTSGHIYLSSLPNPLSRFFDHEFVVNNGKWYSKYPPGQSFFLALGYLVKLEFLINPIFSTLSLGLIFLIVRQYFNSKAAFLSISLLATSPFYIMVSSTFLSHPTTLFFTVLFLLSSLKTVDAEVKNRKIWLSVTAVSLGIILLTRPFNILFLILIFLLTILSRSFSLIKLSKLSVVCLLSPIFFLFCVGLIYNLILTGSPFILPVNVYSPFDKPGFGLRGTEQPLAFTPKIAITNLIANFISLKSLLLPQPLFLLLLSAPFAFVRHFKVSCILILLFFLQAAFYFFYFYPGTFLGPRYWFESAWTLVVLTAIGLEYLVSKITSRFFKKILYTCFVFFILYSSTAFDIKKLPNFQGYNGMSKVAIPQFSSPSVVFISSQDNWQAYGRFFYLQSPILSNNKIIFARDRGIYNIPKNLLPLSNNLLMTYFPHRQAYIFQNNQFEPIVLN